MTPKQKQIIRIYEYLKGKQVKVWLIGQSKQTDAGPYCTGLICPDWGLSDDGKGVAFLVLKNVKLWDGAFQAEYSIAIKTIKKIEEINETT